MRAVKLCAVLVSLLVLLPVSGLAQAPTASTAVVQGTVTDPTGAVIPGADVTLTDLATNLTRSTTTAAGGVYIFASVASGTYRVTVKKEGFRQAVIPSVKIDVARSHLLNFTLEVGAVAETVEVTATAAVELQTTDATVGNVLAGEALARMPIPDRSVASLILLQPTVAPGRGVGNEAGGQVAGARSDQNVFLLDGGDATSNTEGTGGYNTGFVATPQPVIPVPAESIEEFRVGTTNPNATFGRSEGAQVSMVTRRGSNDFHGSAYWYHQNDNLNANSWDLNSAGVRKPELKQNRFGASAGGRIIRDKTFIYGHYEGWRFPKTSTITRLVPRDSLRLGNLTFRDLAGNINTYNLGTAVNCGPTAFDPCDPRGLGISPVISALWGLYPAGNVPAVGDGLNTIGLRVPVSTTLDTDFTVVRLDHKLSDNWNTFASYRYYRRDEPGTQQIDIAGLTGPGVHSTRKNPLDPRYAVLGVSGQITPTLTSETRLSWFRHWWEWQTQAPFPWVPGTNAALDVTNESVTGILSDPINVDTQQARARVWNGKDTFIAQNLNWVIGKHTIQFGGSYRHQDIFHMRTDKVLGGLSTGTIYYLSARVPPGTISGAGSFFSVGDAARPPLCLDADEDGVADPGDIFANCLRSADIPRWDVLYATNLGIIDRATQLLARDGDLNARTLGTPLTANVLVQAVEFFGQDVWRASPSLTLTLGLTYQVQRPPVEDLGLQSTVVYRDSLEPVYLDAYFRRRAEAAQRGQVFNPEIAFMPIRQVAAQRYVTQIDWNNFAPRLAAAWNPSFQNRFFGDRKTVLRGGYGVTYTRMNGVGLVMTPILGVGLGEILSCRGPRSALPGFGGCGGSGANPSNAFRVGVDGAGVPLPAPGPARIPFTVGQPFRELLSFMIDPGFKPGISHSFDATWQRELPGNMLLEVGYVGRIGRNLQQSVDLNAMPHFFLDPASGQTLAQAFDAVSLGIRGGLDPFLRDAAGDPIGSNPSFPAPLWFENQLNAVFPDDPSTPLVDESGCMGTLGFTCTGMLLHPDIFDLASSFRVGDLASTMLFGADLARLLFGGLTPYNNIQVLFQQFTTDRGYTDYHGGFVSLRKRLSQGLTFDVNYTLAKSIDSFGLNQENTFFSFATPYDTSFDKEPSLWDRRHVLNATWFYDLPFGRGRRFAPASGALDRIVGGWYVSGIYTANSGLPLCVFGGTNYGAINAFSSLCTIPIRKPNFGNSVHRNAGVGGVGTNADPAEGGSGFNLFADPKAVFDNFRFPLLSQDTRFGFGALRGLPRWNLDLGIGKKTSLTETVKLLFSFDLINAFNRRELGDPGTDLNDPASFGVLSSQFGGPRIIQFGFRIEF